ncbi:GNAT family N-acetyltransferase [Streptomyces sp. SID13031]|uniref:GNAT family N-acetyltransferase n=1 Tax=Streptomyces sp. SID13031 TaxID=2706046 RepID=UPI0013C6CF5F|nr:GNAT family N-acetyltransferase [Streptomyces sp. SID13031]NEA36970.1 GNAT family N-acetyltransferase [Streptomyces sp. SID13031]
MRIRKATADDAAAVSRLRRETYSYSVMSPAYMRHQITVQTPGQRVLALVAEDGDDVVGWGSAALNVWTSKPGQSDLTIYVHPTRRREGIGGSLVERLHGHLSEVGAERIRTFATPAGLPFATKLGYEPSRVMHYSGVDPRVLPEQPPVPDGIRIATLDTLEPRQVFVADTAASLDEPGDSPIDSVDYDNWLDEIWNSPSVDKALGVAALAGDEVACFTSIESDGDRAWSGMTGTVPQYRGRGLAKLVKSVALRRCADAGIVGAFTSNDDANGPMLAVNAWLGYRRIETQTSLLRML